MKKFYLFAFLMLIGCELSAHGLTFYLGNVKIEPNSTVYFNDIKIDDTGNGVDYTMAPEVFLLSDDTASDITVKSTCTSGQRIQLCAGGQCATGVTVEKTGVAVKAGEKLDIQFECMGYTNSADEAIPEVTAEISARCGKDNEEVKFTIVMNGKNNAIDNIIADEALCDAFTITGARIAQGKTMSEIKAQLPQGSYILRSANGNSRKIVIR